MSGVEIAIGSFFRLMNVGRANQGGPDEVPMNCS